MKILKISLLIIFILIVCAVISAYFFLKTIDVNQFKEQIAEEISASLDRDAELGHIEYSFSLGKGFAFVIKDLKVKDHPRFSNDYFLNIKEVSLSVDVSKAITKKQFNISKVQIDSPQLKITRNIYGQFNFDKFGQGRAGNAEKSSDSPQAPPEVSVEKGSLGNTDRLSLFLVKNLDITNASVTFLDKKINPEKALKLTKIDFSVTDFSLLNPFEFYLGGAFEHASQNFQLSGTSRINLKNQQVRCDDVEVKTMFKSSSIKPLFKYLPDADLDNLIENIEWKMKGAISQVILGQQGALVLTMDGQILGGELKLKPLKIPFENIFFNFDLSDTEMLINEFSMNFGRGIVRGNGEVGDYLNNQFFNVNIEANNIPIENLIEENMIPVKVSGQVDSNFSAKGRGFTQQQLEQNLHAMGNVEVKSFKLIDFNVLKLTLGKISMIPGIVEIVEKTLPTQYESILKEKDTIIDKFEMNMNVRNGIASIPKAEVESKSFIVNGQGSLDFELNSAVNVSLMIPDLLSENIVKPLPELEPLLNQYGQIYIPMKPYTGKLKDMKITPDYQYLTKKVIVHRGKLELQKIINRALDIEGEDEQPLEDGPHPDDKLKRPEDLIIENVLDAIFDKKSKQGAGQ